MKCICGGNAVVKDGRTVPEGYWRRRKCDTCNTNYTSIEQFCVTEMGTRTKPGRIHVPKVAKVVSPQSRKAKTSPPIEKPVVYKGRNEYKKREPRTAPVAVTRNRIEDLRMAKELDQLDRGWE